MAALPAQHSPITAAVILTWGEAEVSIIRSHLARPNLLGWQSQKEVIILFWTQVSSEGKRKKIQPITNLSKLSFNFQQFKIIRVVMVDWKKWYNKLSSSTWKQDFELKLLT